MNREQIGKFLILRELQHKEQIGKLNELGVNTLLQLQFDEDELNKKDMKEVLEFIDELEQNQTQKAIDCLKDAQFMAHTLNRKAWDEYIDAKIKELKGEIK